MNKAAIEKERKQKEREEEAEMQIYLLQNSTYC